MCKTDFGQDEKEWNGTLIFILFPFLFSSFLKWVSYDPKVIFRDSSIYMFFSPNSSSLQNTMLWSEFPMSGNRTASSSNLFFTGVSEIGHEGTHWIDLKAYCYYISTTEVPIATHKQIYIQFVLIYALYMCPQKVYKYAEGRRT